MSAPEPSPAPTLDPHFPGYWPTTPADELPPTSSSLGAQEALEPIAGPRESAFERAEHALLDVAHGIVAKVGELAGMAPQVDGIDDLTRNLQPSTHTDEASTAAPTGDHTAVDETHRPEFGTPAVEKEQADLAASPAQRLLGGDGDNSAKIGAGAVAGALLAGAAGAKIEENEVREPGVEDNELERKGLVEPQESTPAAPAPNFGTPAIEKEQAFLAASPAQQLLRADSSVRADKAALLAGAAGAKLGPSREIEEPARAPLDVAVEKAVEAGAGVPSPTSEPSESAHAVPLEREVSTPLAPLDASSSTPSDRPSLPTPHGSTTSFAADVLAAGEGIETPLEAPGPAAAGFGVREHGEIIATDRELDESGSTPKLSNKATLPPVESDVTPPTTRAQDDNEDEHVVHNPSPFFAGAAVGSIAGAAVGSELGQRCAPQDFAPYTPPIVEPTPGQAELQHAAAVPVPDTPAVELQQAVAVPIPETPTTEQPAAAASSTTKPLSPAVFGASAPLPLPHAAAHGNAQTSDGETVPATVNAQNVKEEVKREGATTPGSERIELETALDEGPAAAPQKKDKGKGKEVLGAAAAGTAGVGAGVGMREMLDGDQRDNGQTAHSNTSDLHLDTATTAAPLPTNSTLDSTHNDPFYSKPDPLSEQRAFPTVPHMHMCPTDEAVFDKSVGDGEAARRARVLDPKELANANAPTSPEQAGFTNVTEVTPAMRDFARLSAPAPQAEEHALAEAPAAGSSGAGAPVAQQPIEPVTERTADDDRHSNVPLIAGAGIAGIGAGAAGAGLIARDHASPAQQAPPAAAIGAGAPAVLSPAAAPAATPAAPAPVSHAAAQPAAAHPSAPPVGAADAHSAHTAAPPAAAAAATPAPAEKRTPVSRFTEETFYPSASGTETPSSTRAVMGSPPSSVRDRNSAATTPVQSTTPTQSLFEAGILEKSPHMKIQTHKVDGHKRLHRKSLSGVVAPGGGSLSRRSGESPRNSPRQSMDVDRSQATAAVPAGARRSPVNTEGRRDRMLDDMAGVRDPTTGGYDSPRTAPGSAASSPRHSTHSASAGGVAQTYPGVPPTSHVTATYGPGGAAGPIPSGSAPSSAAAQAHAHPHAQAHPQAQAQHPQVQATQSGATVGRKLSKKHHAPGTPEKSGFFSRMFGSGSKNAPQ
ncbi:hypothetical protein JCM10450v2_002739 [Rhodotorula kratochvilovae]